MDRTRGHEHPTSVGPAAPNRKTLNQVRAAARCIAARQLGDAAHSGVRLEAEQDNLAGQACGASMAMRQEVTRLEDLAREFAVGLECAEDVDALSGGRSQEYRDRFTASLRIERECWGHIFMNGGSMAQTLHSVRHMASLRQSSS
eukprot:47792-Eustigmatos_ZCMA.PRE.1